MSALKNNRLLIISFTENNDGFFCQDVLPELTNKLRSTHFQYESVILNRGAHNLSELTQKIQKSTTIAVIFILEPQIFTDEIYRKTLQTCIDKNSKRKDFNLYVGSFDFTYPELDKEKKSDKLIGNLFETVQISQDAKNLINIDDIAFFLSNFSLFRDSFFYNKLKSSGGIVFGVLSLIVEIISLFYSVTFFILSFIKAPILANTAIINELTSFSSGIIIFPLWLIPLYFLQQRRYFQLIKSPPKKIFYTYLVGFVCSGILGLSFTRFKLILSWFILGFCLGILLDFIRRNGIVKYLLYKKTLDPKNIYHNYQRLPRYVHDLVKGYLPFPFACSLFPELEPNIFVSHTHHSAWNKRLTTELFGRMDQAGKNIFLDRKTILSGSNWHITTDNFFCKSNLFLGIVDKETITSKWCATELENAILLRTITGKPHILLIVDKDILSDNDIFTVIILLKGLKPLQLNQPKDDKPKLKLKPKHKPKHKLKLKLKLKLKPIFIPIIDKYKRLQYSNEYNPRIIEFNDKTVDIVSSMLRTYKFKSFSVFSQRTKSYLEKIVSPFLYSLNLIGALCSFTGFIIGIVVIQQMLTGNGLLTFLINRKWYIPVFIFIAYNLGFCFRLILASRFELTDLRTHKVSTTVNSISLLSFLFSVVILCQYITAFYIITGILFCLLAWYLASYYVSTVLLVKKDMKRKV